MTVRSLPPRPAWPAALLLILLTGLTGCGQLQKQQTIQNDLAVAQQQAQLGNLPKARQWSDRAIAVSPQELTTYIAASSADGSLVLLGIADPGDGEHGVFSCIGDDADVVTYMTQAAAKFPDNFAPLVLLSAAQGRLGDTAGRRASAAKTAALIEHQLTVPGHAISAGLLNTLAQAYWDSGDAAKGAATFRRVIATYPHDPEVANAYNGLAYDYAVANDKPHLTEALSLAKTALSLAEKQGQPDQGIGAIQDTLGWVQYRMGDYKNALLNVERGVNSNPRLAEGRYHLAMIYKAIDDQNAARIELSYAVRLNPGYAAAQRELQALPSPAPLSADNHA